MQQLGFAQPEDTYRRLTGQHSSSRYKNLPELSRQRFDALMPMVISQSAQEGDPDQTLGRVSDLMDSICRRASYLALLAEFPDALALVTKLAGASPWLSQYLSQHPILLDELLDTRNLYGAPDFKAMRTELQRRLAEVEGDVERQMDVMRHFKHAAVFRFAAKDVAGDMESVLSRLRRKYGKGEMPRTLNFITGPSRSGDIEQKLLLGAHGPRALHIILVGD